MKKLNLMLITAILTLLLSMNLMAYTEELDPETPLENYISIGEFNTDGSFDHWDFAEFDDRSVTGGCLNGYNSSGNPHMARMTSQDIVFEIGTIVETRMRFDVGTGNDKIEMLPRIDGSESLIPGLKLAGGTVPTQTDGEFHVYRMTLDANDNTKYFGQLTSTRFDPADRDSIGDNFCIDYIRIANVISTNPPYPYPPYVDNEFNHGLLHCNKMVTNLWPDGSTNCFITPDDNSSGRLAASSIMNASNDWGIARDDSTMPTLNTNSPYGGDYLAFDGNDSILVTNSWSGGDNMDLDLSFRFNGLPPIDGDNYAGLFWSLPVKAYLRNDDDIHGKILMLVYDAAGSPHFFYSTKIIHSNVWYRLSFSASNNNLRVVIGNENAGYITDTASVTGLLAPSASVPFYNVIIGSDYFGPARLFHGDIDETKWGVIVPEPTMFFMILICLGLIKRTK